MNIFLTYIIMWLIMNLITLMLYWLDKYKASKGKWRIKEATLLICTVLLGAIGALIGMKIIRHKTKHWYFWLVSIISLIIQVTLLYYFYQLQYQ